MAKQITVESSKRATDQRAVRSPLERAQEIAASMTRSEKEKYWLEVRMENFLREYERRIDSVTVREICDYLERLLRRGQPDWQVKQSLEAIGLLMSYGYERVDLGVPQLREAFGVRLNERVGVVMPEAPSADEGKSAVVVDRIRRVLRGALRGENGEGVYSMVGTVRAVLRGTL